MDTLSPSGSAPDPSVNEEQWSLDDWIAAHGFPGLSSSSSQRATTSTTKTSSPYMPTTPPSGPQSSGALLTPKPDVTSSVPTGTLPGPGLFTLENDPRYGSGRGVTIPPSGGPPGGGASVPAGSGIPGLPQSGIQPLGYGGGRGTAVPSIGSRPKPIGLSLDTSGVHQGSGSQPLDMQRLQELLGAPPPPAYVPPGSGIPGLPQNGVAPPSYGGARSSDALYPMGSSIPGETSVPAGSGIPGLPRGGINVRPLSQTNVFDDGSTLVDRTMPPASGVSFATPPPTSAPLTGGGPARPLGYTDEEWAAIMGATVTEEQAAALRAKQQSAPPMPPPVKDVVKPTVVTPPSTPAPAPQVDVLQIANELQKGADPDALAAKYKFSGSIAGRMYKDGRFVGLAPGAKPPTPGDQNEDDSPKSEDLKPYVPPNTPAVQVTLPGVYDALADMIMTTPEVEAGGLSGEQMAALAEISAKLAVDPQMQYLQRQLDSLSEKTRVALQPVMDKLERNRKAAVARELAREQETTQRLARTRLYTSPYGQDQITRLQGDLENYQQDLGQQAVEATAQQQSKQGLEETSIRNQMQKLTEQQGARAQESYLKLANTDADRQLRAGIANQKASEFDRAQSFKEWMGNAEVQQRVQKMLLDENFRARAQDFKEWLEQQNLNQKERAQAFKAWSFVETITEKAREADATNVLKDIISKRDTTIKAGNLAAKLTQILGYLSDESGTPLLDEEGRPILSLGAQKMQADQIVAFDKAMVSLASKHSPETVRYLLDAMMAPTGSQARTDAFAKAQQGYINENMRAQDAKIVVGFYSKYPTPMAEAAERLYVSLLNGDTESAVSAAEVFDNYQGDPYYSSLAKDLLESANSLAAADARAAATLKESMRYHNALFSKWGSEAGMDSSRFETQQWINQTANWDQQFAQLNRTYEAMPEIQDFRAKLQAYTLNPGLFPKGPPQLPVAKDSSGRELHDAAGNPIPLTLERYVQERIGPRPPLPVTKTPGTSGPSPSRHDAAMSRIREAATEKDALTAYIEMNPNPTPAEQDVLEEYLQEKYGY